MSIPENKDQPSSVLGKDTHEKWRQKVNETIDRINSLYQSDQELWVDGNIHNKGYHSLKNENENETIKIDANGDSYILSGNVGIGTSSPSFGLLQIQNSEGNNNFLSLRSSGTGNRMLSTWIDDTNSTINFDSRYSTGGSYDFRFRAGSTELMRIETDQTFEFKTSTGTLHIEDYGGSSNQIRSSASLGLWSGAGTSVNLGVDETIILNVNSNGNVGIGTWSPGAKLEVGGDTHPELRIAADSSNGDPFLTFWDRSTTQLANMEAFQTAGVLEYFQIGAGTGGWCNLYRFKSKGRYWHYGSYY